jgi:metal-responsive CopG/Arc/MetJ family transcriptional regulator
MGQSTYMRTLTKAANVPHRMSKKLITEVPDELYEAVQAQIKKEERSQAQIVRRALRLYLGHEKGAT